VRGIAIGTQDWSVAWGSMVASTAALKPVYWDSRNKSGGYRGWALSKSTFSDGMFLQIRSSTQNFTANSIVVGTGAWTTGVWRDHVLAVDRDGYAKYYMDGTLIASVDVSTAATYNITSAQPLRIGAQYQTGYSLDGAWGYACQWTGRVLTHQDATMLHVDPFAMYRPTRRWWYTSGTGGPVTQYISGSLSIGSAGTTAGVVVAPVAGTLPVGAAGTAAGAIVAPVAGALAIGAAGQAQGNVVAPIAGALPIGAAGSAGGAVVAPVGGALSIGAAGSAAGVVVAPVGGALAIGAAGSADGVVVAPVAGSLPIGAGGAAAGNVVAPVAASMNIGSAGQVQGVVVAPIAGELEIGAEGTAAGTVVTEGGARGWLAPVLESGRYES
jgi:hypothetical protein